jgi:DNA ligase (NAD+)
LYALGIRYVGETTAKKLATHFRSMENLKNADFEELISVEEVGEKIAQSVLDYFSKGEQILELEKLKAAGLQFEIEENNVSISTILSGKSFVVSGVFTRFSREEIKQLIEANGGKNASSISAKTDYVLAGENMGPAKLKKAESLKIPILSEYDFIRMIED